MIGLVVLALFAVLTYGFVRAARTGSIYDIFAIVGAIASAAMVLFVSILVLPTVIRNGFRR